MSGFSYAQHPLEGDGIIEHLYSFLHALDELDQSPRINIPDTIIYKFRQPALWFFTSKSGRIKRKSKYNLVNVRIEETLSRKSGMGSEIVAYYLSTSEETGDTTIEYFNKAGLSDFLYNRDKVDNGVLQRFIEPKGTNNSMLRAIWSPKVLLLERRVNVRRLQDRKFSLYERAVTYEGAEHNSQAAPVRGSILPSAVQKICRDVVAHVAEVSFQKFNVSRLALNFKVDPDDSLWLLWCSSLRMESEAPAGSHHLARAPSKRGPVNVDTLCTVPYNVRVGFNTTRPNSSRPSDLVRCTSCSSMVLSDRFHNVPYKTVIAHFEQLVSVLAAGSGGMHLEWPPDPQVIAAFGGVGLGPLHPGRGITASSTSSTTAATELDIEVPPVLREIHPNLSVGDYRRYRHDPLFLYKTVSVCEDCYLVFAEVASSAPADPSLCGFATEARMSRTAQRRHAARRAVSRTATAPLRRPRARPVSTASSGAGFSRTDASTAPAGASRRMRKMSGPSIPPRIDSSNVRSLQVSESMPLLSAALNTSVAMESVGFGEKSDVGPTSFEDGTAADYRAALPESFQKTLQEREDAFFRDLYQNPNLQKGHPLNHMIVTQAKLSMTRTSQASPTLRGLPQHQQRSASRGGPDGLRSSESMPRLAGGSTPMPSPYAVPLAYPRRSGGANRTIRSSGAKESAPEAFSELPSTEVAHPKSRRRAPKKLRSMRRGQRSIARSGEAASAARHRDFLINTLQEVRDQLSNPSPLLDAIDVGHAADLAGERIEQGRDLEGAWDARPSRSPGGSTIRVGAEVSGRRLMLTVSMVDGGCKLSGFDGLTGEAFSGSIPADDMDMFVEATESEWKATARNLAHSLQLDADGHLLLRKG